MQSHPCAEPPTRQCLAGKLVRPGGNFDPFWHRFDATLFDHGTGHSQAAQNANVEINVELTRQTRGATVDKERAVFLHNESVTKDGWLKV